MMAFWRLLFLHEPPSTPLPAALLEFTAFTAAIEAGRMIDLVADPIPATAHLTDYSVSQAFADAARAEAIDDIAQGSVRCPSGGTCLTWLTCAVFAKPAPVERRSWRLHIDRNGVLAIREFPDRLLILRLISQFSAVRPLTEACAARRRTRGRARPRRAGATLSIR